MAEKKWSRHQYRIGGNPEVSQQTKDYLSARARSIADQYAKVMNAQRSVSAKIFFRDSVRKFIKGDGDAGSSGNSGTGE